MVGSTDVKITGKQTDTKNATITMSYDDDPEGECLYEVRLTWTESHHVDFVMLELPHAQEHEVAHGEVKWGGCTIWDTGPTMFHACEPEDMDRIHTMLRLAMLLGRRMICPSFPHGGATLTAEDQAALAAVVPELADETGGPL